MDYNDYSQDICKFCRLEASVDKPLYHPCICTGSIKYIHQECLVQWLNFSKKDYCELCEHKFSFMPIYTADMPKRLPLKDIITEILDIFLLNIKLWFYYTFIAFIFLILIPVLTFRILKYFFNACVNLQFSLPLDLFNIEDLTTDGFYGIIIVFFTVSVFFTVVWLGERIIFELPEWLRNVPQVNENLERINNLNNEIIRNNNESSNLDNFEQNNLGLSAIHDQPNLNLVNIVDNINNIEYNDVNNINNVNAPAVHNDLNWDRNVDDLIFERVFRLEESFNLIEYVILVLILNMIFIFKFIFCLYHVGLFLASKLSLVNFEAKKNLNNVLLALFSYIIIASVSILVHMMIYQFQRTKTLLKLNYLIIKISIFTILTLVVLPIICGCSLEVFSLPIFESTLPKKEDYFMKSLIFSIFSYWFIGLMFIVYVLIFFVALNYTLRKCVFWLIYPFDDEVFDIDKMINLSLFVSIRKFFQTLSFFIFIIFISVFLPIKATESFTPGFLPFNFSYISKTEMSDGLIFLHLLIILLFDINKIKQFLMSFVRLSCLFIAYLLDLKAFLIADNENENLNNDVIFNLNLMPKYFYLKLLGLVILTCLFIFLNGFSVIIFPAFLGRTFIAIIIKDYKFNDYNSILCGISLILFTVNIINYFIRFFTSQFNVSHVKLQQKLFFLVKSILVLFFMFVFVPLLLGSALQVLAYNLIRVPLEQTPIYYFLYDWVLGCMVIRFLFLLSIEGELDLKEVQELYKDKVNIDFKDIVDKIFLPFCIPVGLVISIPYVLVNGFLNLFNIPLNTLTFILRNLYALIWSLSVFGFLYYVKFFNFSQLYEHVKNKKYLVDRKLINYNRKEDS